MVSDKIRLNQTQGGMIAGNFAFRRNRKQTLTVSTLSQANNLCTQKRKAGGRQAASQPIHKAGHFLYGNMYLPPMVGFLLSVCFLPYPCCIMN